MRKTAVALITVLATSAGCVSRTESPVVPLVSGPTMGLPEADSTQVGKRGPGDWIDATPPSFPGWQVVSGSSTSLTGPWYDRDWLITFYLPNRSSLPSVRNVAAKNVWGTWLLYNRYADLYSHGRSGTSYRVTYLFGGRRAIGFNVNMHDPTNWAFYYQ